VELTAASLPALLGVMKRVPLVDRDVKLKGIDREGNKAKKVIAHETVPVINENVDRFVVGVLRAHGELLIPVGVKSLLDDLSLLCAVVLFALRCGHTDLHFTEWIAEAKSIGFGEIPSLNAPHSHCCIFIHSLLCSLVTISFCRLSEHSN